MCERLKEADSEVLEVQNCDISPVRRISYFFTDVRRK